VTICASQAIARVVAASAMGLLLLAACAMLVLACSGPSGTPGGDAGRLGAPDAGRLHPTRDAGALDASVGPAGEPALSLLRVEGAGAPIVLYPAFSPTVFDYSVRCHAGANPLKVTVTAEPGAEGRLVQPTRSPSRPTQTLDVTVDEGAAIVAAATAGAATTQYWVRCLPQDFPPFEWTAHPEAGTVTAGYYLIGNYQSPEAGAYAWILDTHGAPVWYQRTTARTGALDVDSLEPGEISFDPTNTTYPPPPFRVERISPWSSATVTTAQLDGHELRRLSNGDYLLFAEPVASGVDLTGLSIELRDGGRTPLGPNETISDCVVEEISPAGAVNWKWSALAHFDPAKDATYVEDSFPPIATADGGLVVDPFHCNSIDVDSTEDGLLISSRAMDSIFFVDKRTGAVRWKMGGAASTKDGAVFVSATNPFRRQHDARLAPDWSSSCASGHVTVFDDQTQTTNRARAVEYEVTAGLADAGVDCGAAPRGAKTTWQYDGTVASSGMGSFRISADGSRVIGWGVGGEPGRVFTEVDLAGRDLADFTFGDGSSSYRAVKVPPAQFDLGVLRATAGAH
jgi:Arylsulfotransferase (ASST)